MKNSQVVFMVNVDPMEWNVEPSVLYEKVAWFDPPGVMSAVLLSQIAPPLIEAVVVVVPVFAVLQSAFMARPVV